MLIQTSSNQSEHLGPLKLNCNFTQLPFFLSRSARNTMRLVSLGPILLSLTPVLNRSDSVEVNGVSSV